MKYKTSELTGALLDAAVAKAAGMSFEVVPQKVWGDGSGITIVSASPACMVNHDYFEPSISWADGGPIIERDRIALVGYGGTWDAAVSGFVATDFSISSESGSAGEAEDAPTALVAAMRAFVGAKLGAEVDL